ncbi:MAG TPA: tetratricopeptide repeat protein [Gemmatimonas sp.]|nr:tetratricopeptide repeat protein [Gemmatimonas sp.]
MVFACSAFCLFGPAALPAQQLAPKRTLTTGPAPGCGAARPGQTTVARRNNVEAQRLATTGQEALLVGDQAAARDAFARAAALNPGDERVAYDLARAHEELADASSAIREYCRYLTLTPGGSEAADVRGRLSRLVPRAEQQRAEDVAVAFRLGLALFDDGRFDAASRAFGDVVKNEPTAPEAFFNRGLAQAAAGRRSLALTDLEQYRAAAPTIDDRVQVGRAIEVLRRPVFNPSVALARSLLPGFGQLYTGRPVRGLLLFVATGAAAGMSFTKQTSEREIAYVDPNGVPAPYTERSTKRPYFVPAISAAAGVAVLGMIDAIRYARRSQRGASIVEVRAAGMQSMPGGSAVSLAPAIGINGGPGVLLRARF